MCNAWYQCPYFVFGLFQQKFVLSSYVVAERKNVVRRKFSNKTAVTDKLPAKMGYDCSVLYPVVVEDVDILVTGIVILKI